MEKSPEAFRTISEVAETLETPAHVLRFWESRFPQIRPVKRAGGRRYYRPADVALLTGIKRLLHDDGLTIRGVQKILREQGVRHVAALAGVPEADLIPFDAELALEEAMAERFGAVAAAAMPLPEIETAQIFALESALRKPGGVGKPVLLDLFDLVDASETDEVPSVAEQVADPLPDVPDVAGSANPQAMPEPAHTPPPTEAAPWQPAKIDLVASMPVAAVIDQDEPALNVTRAALLRALSTPLPDDLRRALLPLRARIAATRDAMIAAAQADGHRG